jgi:hypothetical protein
MEALLTKYQKKKIERESRIYAEYMALLSQDENNSKVEVAKAIMKKFDIHAISTIYGIIKRVERREGKRRGE